MKAGEPAGVRRPINYGWLFSAIWLVYLWYPVCAVLDRPALWAKAVGVAAIVAFAVVFAATFARVTRYRRALNLEPPWWVWLSLVAMGALVVALVPLAGQTALTGTIYIATLATMTLPNRSGWSVAAGLVAAILLASAFMDGWESGGFFVVQLLLSAFAGWGVSMLILRNLELAQVREQLSALAVVAERERLGRDIHDILGHSLSVITIKAELAGRLLDSVRSDGSAGADSIGGDRARREIADVEALARQSLADVRRTVVGLRNVTLTGELAGARSALEAAGIAAQLPNSIDDVPERRRDLFAWALREGITNVVRHSGAGRCRVRLSAEVLEVADDGGGMSTAAWTGARATTEGTGLKGLQDRVDAAGGVLVLSRSDLGGVSLRVQVAG
ncbi:sensor histidine kinase [Speluncibacter jeojiensis]|uniref:sensor histidine kinase n=1 Tax=Speluncibacter jeojiensis TaxID=2710754 RepID=UPI00240FF2F7|nr:histidine kinase [Rhodococcus sp. D2-41]